MDNYEHEQDGGQRMSRRDALKWIVGTGFGAAAAGTAGTLMIESSGQSRLFSLSEALREYGGSIHFPLNSMDIRAAGPFGQSIEIHTPVASMVPGPAGYGVFEQGKHDPSLRLTQDFFPDPTTPVIRTADTMKKSRDPHVLRLVRNIEEMRRDRYVLNIAGPQGKSKWVIDGSPDHGRVVITQSNSQNAWELASSCGRDTRGDRSYGHAPHDVIDIFCSDAAYHRWSSRIIAGMPFARWSVSHESKTAGSGSQQDVSESQTIAYPVNGNTVTIVNKGETEGNRTIDIVGAEGGSMVSLSYRGRYREGISYMSPLFRIASLIASEGERRLDVLLTIMHDLDLENAGYEGINNAIEKARKGVK